MTIAGAILLCAGIIFAVAGVVGFYRFPDVYLRVKAYSLIGLPAAILIHVASSLVVPPGIGRRGLITALLYLLSGPVGCHVILLAARRLGIPGAEWHEKKPDLGE